MGGGEADPNSIPWQVAMVYANSNRFVLYQKGKTVLVFWAGLKGCQGDGNHQTVAKVFHISNVLKQNSTLVLIRESD